MYCTLLVAGRFEQKDEGRKIVRTDMTRQLNFVSLRFEFNVKLTSVLFSG
jgi:hypothetical protein